MTPPRAPAIAAAAAPALDHERAAEDLRFVLASGWTSERQAMLLLDADWVVTACSRGVLPVLGFAGADLVGQPVEALFAGIPEAQAFLLRLRGTTAAQPFSENAWMPRRDGLRMWAELACVAEAGADGRPRQFCLSARDATLQYRASLAVRSQADVAAAAVSARNFFLGSIAHELRSALAPITMAAGVLEKQATGPAGPDRLTLMIRRNAATAARLVEDLLAFSTLSANKMVMRPVPVDLYGLLVECTESARPQAAAAGIQLQLEDCAPQEKAPVHCDPTRIRQVVMNLVGNAIKFTPAGGSVFVRLSRRAGGCAIEVADTGAGIDARVLPHIFDPFEQGGPDITKRHGGFGLGLAISADIARQHGGKLTATSAGLGQGASFRLELPADGMAAGSDRDAERGPGALRVLYVEDDVDAADAMRYALATLGWQMTHTPSCAGARALVRERPESFDVVLADLGLPDGSGLDLGSELRGILPIVALTAYGAPLAMQGFADLLIKPADVSEIQRALAKAVAAHRSRALADGADGGR